MSDVHLLADQVRSKCGPKDAERTVSGTLTPRFSAIQENDNQVSAAGNQLKCRIYFPMRSYAWLIFLQCACATALENPSRLCHCDSLQ